MGHSVIRRRKLSASSAVIIAISTFFSSLTFVDSAFASTTDQANIAALAQQLVTYSQKVHDGGLAQSLAQPVLQVLNTPGFDWNYVMFGTDSLSTWQSSVSTTLTPTIEALSTFTITSTTQATQILNTAISDLQTLNPNVTESEAISFLQAMGNNGPNVMLTLLSQKTSQSYASILHSSFEDDLYSAPDVQAVFGTSAPGTTSSATSAGSGSGSSNTGGSTSTTSSGTTSSSGSSTSTSSGSTTSGSTTSSSGGTSSTGTSSGAGTTSSSGSTSGSSSNTGSTTGSSSSSSGSTSNTGTTTSTFPNILNLQAFTSSGGQLTAQESQTQIQLSVASGTFTQPVLVALTGSNISLLQSIVPSGYNAIAAVGVAFAGATPSQAVTLTILNKGITPDSKVYKIIKGYLVPIQATVMSGQAIITFSSDPDFVIVTPVTSTAGGSSSNPSGGTGTSSTTTTPSVTLGKNQRAILINGKIMKVPVVVQYHTTYMPIWYVGEVLRQLGDQYHWNGRDWRITTPSSIMPDFTHLKPGKGTMGIYLNGKLVERVNGIYAKDPSTKHMTTYMPIWYVMQMLKRVHLNTTWNGKEWSFPTAKQK